MGLSRAVTWWGEGGSLGEGYHIDPSSFTLALRPLVAVRLFHASPSLTLSGALFTRYRADRKVPSWTRDWPPLVKRYCNSGTLASCHVLFARVHRWARQHRLRASSEQRLDYSRSNIPPPSVRSLARRVRVSQKKRGRREGSSGGWCSAQHTGTLERQSTEQRRQRSAAKANGRSVGASKALGCHRRCRFESSFCELTDRVSCNGSRWRDTSCVPTGVFFCSKLVLHARSKIRRKKVIRSRFFVKRRIVPLRMIVMCLYL